MIFKKQKINDSEVLKFGFLGGIAEAVYVFLAVLFMSTISQTVPAPSHLVTGFLVLLLFVLSAAVSGILVFGYPTYLAFQKRFTEALMTAATTLVTLVIIGILAFILISVVW